MSKPRIIIVDEDMSYVLPLQLKFVEDMFDKVDLEIITDRAYFEQFLSNPQKANVLIISERVYSATVQKHNFKNVFVLTESYDEDDYPGNVTVIYKYTSMKEIFSVILGKTDGLVEDEVSTTKEPQLILVTSAAGGMGKTTVAMGLAAALSKKYKRVLYLNSDYLQNFQWLLINHTPILDNEIYMKMAQNDKATYQSIKHLIRNEIFDYLPPFKNALLSLGLEHSVIAEIAMQAKASKDYDYIIVDADSCFDLEKVKLIGEADKVLIVMTQSHMAVHVSNQFISNIDITDKDKFVFVCNKYEDRRNNSIVMLADTLNFTVNDYIEKFEDYWAMKDEKFFMSMGIQSLAISFL